MINKSVARELPPTQINPSSRRSSKFKIWALVILFVAFLIFLNIYFKQFYYNLADMTSEFINSNTVGSYVMLAGINVALQMLFIPGLTIFLFTLAFTTKSYWHSMALFYPSTVLIIFLSYFVSKHTLRKWIHRKLGDKWYFKMFLEEAKSHPWSCSTQLRVLLIPSDYKNYLIASFDIGFWQYFIPGIIHAYFYFSLFILIGVSFHNIKDIIEGNYPKDDRGRYLFFIIATILMLIGNVCIFVTLIMFTVKKYKGFRKDGEKKEDQKAFLGD